MRRRLLVVLAVLGLLASACTGGDDNESATTGETASGPVTLTFWHGYTDVRGGLVERVARSVERGEPRHPDRPAVRQQRQRAAEAHRRPAGRRAAGHHLPVRLVAPAARGGAGPGRSHRLGPEPRRELGGLRRRAPGRPRPSRARCSECPRSSTTSRSSTTRRCSTRPASSTRTPTGRGTTSGPPRRRSPIPRRSSSGSPTRWTPPRTPSGTTTRSCGRTAARS